MNRNLAEYRRGKPSYNRISRAEYLTRAHEFAPSGDKLAKKLTPQKVQSIRENRNGLTDRQQAEAFGVSVGTIYKVRNRITWGRV